MTEAATITAPEGHALVEELIDGLVDTRRQIAALQAREVILLARALDVVNGQQASPDAPAARREAADIPVRSMAAQIAAALRVSDRTVQRQLSDASVLSMRFPQTLDAWEAGEIARGHVQAIAEAGAAIDDDEARAVFERAALEVAARETPGRLRPAARLLAARLHPVPLAERHAEAARGRGVWVRDLDDGMAELIATLPAPMAHGIRDRIDQFARATIEARRTDATDAHHLDGSAEAKSADRRAIGEVRADVFADLLLTGHATPETTNAALAAGEAIVARVQLTVPVLTVLGADTAPAEITGRGPVDLATALRLAGTATGWDRVLTHPISGSVLAVDRYRPSEHLRRVLRVRDEHCRFPGCRIPTTRCDIDHTTARQHDGPTDLGNLAHLCRRHHTLKHHSAWRVTQAADGTLEWTSPTGRRYPDRAARTLVFTTEPDPPPF